MLYKLFRLAAAMLRPQSRSVFVEPLECRKLLSGGTGGMAYGSTAHLVGGAPRVGYASTAAAVSQPTMRPAKVARVGSPTAVRNATTADNFFPIAVYSQPRWLMQHWADQGVNTAIRYEDEGGSTSLAAWNYSAVSAGLYTIRQPSSSPTGDAQDPHLLGFLLQPDEPDLHGTNPKALQSQYDALKKAVPSMPVMINFSGGYVLHWQGNVSTKTYKAYSAAADWLANDIYPVTGWVKADALDAPGQAVSALAGVSGGKPQFAIIETSNQNLTWIPRKLRHGVSPAQFSAEVWTAINHGAKGICYFPQQIGGFSYDATPANVLAQMKVEDARIAAIGGALESAYDPLNLSLGLNGSLQGSWRYYNGKSYFIVTNLSPNATTAGGRMVGLPAGSTTANVDGENRSIAIGPRGTFTDTFAAYETHVYVVG